jgi:predicted RNA-binding Zn ribbon-like protein
MAEKQFELISGALCLDFMNTIHEYGAVDPDEELHSFHDLIAFGKQTGALSNKEAAQLSERAEANPAIASKMLSAARESRLTMHRIFLSLAHAKVPPNKDLDVFNRQLARILPNIKLQKKGTEMEWAWKEDHQNLECVLWPIVYSAAELLTSEELKLVRECDSETCTWLFLDRSKNRTRRWCDMKKCGNRAKWRRFFNKQKKKN